MVFKTWAPEILALLATLGLGGAMIGLLARFDDQPVFEWNNITLNTIISVLSAAMKALLLYSAAECIGQWKWIMLRGSKRSLIDFERVDLASRGPLGCLVLITRRHTPFLLRLGLLTSILAIVVDPFSQQLLQLQQGVEYVDYLEGEGYNLTYATTSRASTYYGGTQIDLVENSTSLDTARYNRNDSDLRSTQLEFSMEAAILNSFAQSKDAVKQQTPTNCPTSNCTFDTFSTLGVCHTCNDLTDDLEKVGDFGDFFVMMWGYESREDNVYHRLNKESATAFALPNGHFLANVNGCNGRSQDCAPHSPEYRAPDRQDFYALTSYSTSNWNKTVSMKDIHTLIMSMSVIYVDGKKMDEELRQSREDDEDYDDRYERSEWPNAPVAAKECAAYFCMKEIKSEIKGNEIIENATEAESTRIYERRDGEYTPHAIPWALEFKSNLTQKALDDEDRGFYPELFLNYTSPDGENIKVEMDYITYASITEFLKETMTAKWENETKVLERVRDRIPDIKEMFNGAIAGGGRNGFKPGALAGLWTDFQTDVEDKFESLGTSMTNQIRIKGTSPLGRPLSSEVKGRIGLPRTAYRVVWYWFTLHGGILIGCAVFCVATIVLSRDVPVWKSHSLATMSQVPTVIDFGSESNSLRELEKRAKSIEVSLSKDEADSLLRQRSNNGSPGPL